MSKRMDKKITAILRSGHFVMTAASKCITEKAEPSACSFVMCCVVDSENDAILGDKTVQIAVNYTNCDTACIIGKVHFLKKLYLTY